MGKKLYRGKRVDNGKWIIGYLSKTRDTEGLIDKGKLVYCIDWESNGVMVSSIIIPETVGQYTGLPDKNRKRIFEGDIIAHFINWHGKRYNGSVRYENKIACWVCDFVVGNKKESAYLADWAYSNGAEVIGNIHDNPKLLEVIE